MSQNMRFDFNLCPDCGDKDAFVTFYRETLYTEDSKCGRVKAMCSNCDWETGWHDNVKECAEEWNNTVIYE